MGGVPAQVGFPRAPPAARLSDELRYGATAAGVVMTRLPAVSVVLPVYNQAAHFGGALDSILAQTFLGLRDRLRRRWVDRWHSNGAGGL
jgi:hypothetical protein